MPNRISTSLAGLLVVTTLVATPASATNSVAGSKGQGAADGVNRAAPFTPPGKAVPMPVPQVDPSSLSRGPLALDLAAATESMGTITLSSDGSVSEQPASEGLRGILDTEIKGSKPSAHSGGLAGPGDTRSQVTDTSSYPAAAVGWLWTEDQTGKWSTCTGTLIGPKTVLTAAHCVYDLATAGWAKDIKFIPGATDAQNAPHGSFDWASVNILKGFVSDYDGQNYGSVMPWDLAVVELQEDAGNTVGWMGFEVDDASEMKATILSYPGDKPEGTMWQSTCDVPAANFGDQVFWHTCGTYSGSSGSAMWIDDGKSNLYIRGLNVAEDDKVNYGVRLIDAYFQFIQDNYK